MQLTSVSCHFRGEHNLEGMMGVSYRYHSFEMIPTGFRRLQCGGLAAHASIFTSSSVRQSHTLLGAMSCCHTKCSPYIPLAFGRLHLRTVPYRWHKSHCNMHFPRSELFPRYGQNLLHLYCALYSIILWNLSFQMKLMLFGNLVT